MGWADSGDISKRDNRMTESRGVHLGGEVGELGVAWQKGVVVYAECHDEM